MAQLEVVPALETKVVGVSGGAVGIDGGAALVGELVARHAGHAFECFYFLAERNGADEVVEHEAGIAGSAALGIVGKTSVDEALSVAEGEGREAGAADTV